MTKIIPFAVAVILVLGVGYYLFISRIAKPVSVQTNQMSTTSAEKAGGESNAVGGSGAAGIIVSPTQMAAANNEKVNQITLQVTTPKNNSTVSLSALTVQGTTKPKADVSINEKDVVANANGYFSATVSLEEGDNYVVIVAVDENGDVAEQELNVTYTPNQ
jgi:hypothetical protein